MGKFILQRWYWLFSPLVWGVLLLALYGWNQNEQNKKAVDLARERADFVARLVESTRLWAARHGGVYAPTTPANPPNAWLPVEKRQIHTDSGQPLTLINPSYMTRQLGDVVGELNQDLSVYLVSLKPVNPANQPSDWERAKLQGFAGPGSASVEQLVVENGLRHYRYLKPMYLSEPCLQCHTRPDDVVGALRGAISIAFPAEPLFLANRAYMRDQGVFLFLLWLLMNGLTVLGLSRLRNQMLSLDRAREETEQQVQLRTRELAEKVKEHKQAAAQLKLFIDSAGEGIIGMDLQGCCTMANPKALELLGYTNEQELLGKELHELIHHGGGQADQHTAEDCPMHATLTTGQQVHQDDERFWRKNGAAFPVEYRSYPLYSQDSLIGAVINFSDITLRKERELQLEKISSAMEHSASSAVITDIHGTIEYVNPHFVKTTGYTREEAIGKNPRILQSGVTSRETYQTMWQTLHSGQVWVGELLNRKKDRSLYWEYVRISPIHAKTGEISHFIAIKEDITERKNRDQIIWKQANFDELTGLANRALMRDRLEEGIQRAGVEQTRLALIYVDLDGFKSVNDTLGHAQCHQVKQFTHKYHIISQQNQRSKGPHFG